MKVRYVAGSLYGPGEVEFPFKEDDYVTIVVCYWNSKEEDDDLYYHGHITKFDEEMDGFWAVLDDNSEREELFVYADIEAVIPGDRIPFLGGTSKRIQKEK